MSIPPRFPRKLPAGMVASVPLLPAVEQPVLLLTRHSMREQANGQGFASYALPLTVEGQRLAEQWGQAVTRLSGRQWGRVVSSPIERCLDTAARMLGLPHADHIDTHHLLVEPGSLVLDISLVGGWFRQHGPLQFINAFLQQQLAGMKDPVQGVEDILYLLFCEYRALQAGQLGLAVSHDTLLAAVVGHLQGRRVLGWEDWPEMMEGLFLWFEPLPYDEIPEFAGCTVHWLWRGEQHRYQVSAWADPHSR